MAHVISLTSSKGGSGKTTIALNLAVSLAEMGNHTLLVDLDPQGSIGLALAKGDTEWPGLAEYLTQSRPVDQVIVQTKLPNLSIIPRGRLDPVDIEEYETYLRSSDGLRDLVEQAAETKEYVIFDTPSGLGPVTRAALAVSSFALVPLQAEPLALRSFGQILRVLEHVRDTENPDLKLLGILPNMVRLDQEVSLNVMGTVWSEIKGVLDTCIPRSDVFSEASELGLPVSFVAGRTPPEARRFYLLATELESMIAQLAGTTGDADAKVQRQLV